MAFKDKGKGERDFQHLKTALVNSKFQTENNALFQTINGLIDIAARFKLLTEERLDEINEIFNDITFLTQGNELSNLPNSRQVLAGTGITFNTSIFGQLTISASGSGSGTGYWTPLTDGNVDETGLIFASGESIAVFVPTP